VLPVKDPTSDMPTIARKGSSLVKEYRQKRDENKSRERFWEVAGSKIGDIIGVKKAADGSAPEGEMVGDDAEVDYKADSRCELGRLTWLEVECTPVHLFSHTNALRHSQICGPHEAEK
jgi:hypothetical protein